MFAGISLSPAERAPVVLLLEPHDDTREMMRAWLNHHGFRCAEPSADEGELSALTRVRPDAVLMTRPAAGLADLSEVTALRHATGRRRLAIALIAPAIDARLMEQAREAGAAGCFEKPVALPELLELLRTAATPHSSPRPGPATAPVVGIPGRR